MNAKHKLNYFYLIMLYFMQAFFDDYCGCEHSDYVATTFWEKMKIEHFSRFCNLILTVLLMNKKRFANGHTTDCKPINKLLDTIIII